MAYMADELYRRRLGRMPPGEEQDGQMRMEGTDPMVAPSPGGPTTMGNDRMGGNAMPSYLEPAGAPARPTETFEAGPGGPTPSLPPGVKPPATKGGLPSLDFSTGMGMGNFDPSMLVRTDPPGSQPPTPDIRMQASGDQQDVGVLGQSAIGLGDLGALLERRLAQPSAYGSEEVMSMRDALAQQREKTRQATAGAINADAARRGVFHSTIPAMNTYNLEQGLAGEEAMADATLLDRMASSQDAGLNNAIGQAMGFMGQGMNFDIAKLQTLGSLGGMAGQLGQTGQPTMSSALQALLQLPGGDGGQLDPSLFALLGQLMAGKGQGNA